MEPLMKFDVTRLLTEALRLTRRYDVGRGGTF